MTLAPLPAGLDTAKAALAAVHDHIIKQLAEEG